MAAKNSIFALPLRNESPSKVLLTQFRNGGMYGNARVRLPKVIIK